MSGPAYKPHAPTPLSPCPMAAGVVIVKMECGCTVEGCGHLPDPVRPKLCAKHAAALDLYEACRLIVECSRYWANAFSGERRALDAARAALSKATGDAP